MQKFSCNLLILSCWKCSEKGTMYRIYGLRLGPNFGMRLVAGKNISLRLTFEKMYPFAVFTEKYLRPYGCNDTNFTAVVNCGNPKTEMQSKIIKIEIILTQF